MDLGLIVVGGSSTDRYYLKLEIKDIVENDPRRPRGTILNLQDKKWNFERRFRWGDPSKYYSEDKDFGDCISWRSDLPIGMVVGVFELPHQQNLFEDCYKQDPQKKDPPIENQDVS